MRKETHDAYIRGVCMILLSAFCFACMNVCIRLAGDLPSMQKSFFRNLVAAGFAGFILLKNRVSVQVKKEARMTLAMRCVFGTVGILCNFYAVDHLLVADASILNKLSPFFAVVCSCFLLKETIRPFQAFCIFAAFGGCLFIVKPGFENTDLLPALIGVCGGLGAGIAYTMVRKLGMLAVKGPVIVFYFSLFSCLSILPLVVFHFSPMTARQTLFLLLTGLCAAGGQFSITAAYTYAPAKKISIFDYAQILFAGLFGWMLFAEVPDSYSIIGYVLVVASSFAMFLYNSRQKERSSDRKGSHIA
ncbi:MAG: DMT family transporter [Eubacterium sp.]|nr:DMT family transporter [Eubacterium sp.]